MTFDNASIDTFTIRSTANTLHKCESSYSLFLKSPLYTINIIYVQQRGTRQIHEIKKVHKRALRIPLKDYDAPFDELLIRNNEKTFHDQNLQKLMVEVYESFNHRNPSLSWELFTRKEINYNLRIKDIHTLPKASTASFDTSSISFRGSILWNSTLV